MDDQNIKAEDSARILELWRKLATEDLAVAELCYQNGIYLQACFHCQQSIEKSLKGLIIHLIKAEPPYTHDLIRLYALLESTQVYNPKNSIIFGGLNPYYIRARYPSYREEVSKNLTKQKVESFLKLSKEVIKWLEIS